MRCWVDVLAGEGDRTTQEPAQDERGAGGGRGWKRRGWNEVTSRQDKEKMQSEELERLRREVAERARADALVGEGIKFLFPFDATEQGAAEFDKLVAEKHKKLLVPQVELQVGRLPMLRASPCKGCDELTCTWAERKSPQSPEADGEGLARGSSAGAGAVACSPEVIPSTSRPPSA